MHTKSTAKGQETIPNERLFSKLGLFGAGKRLGKKGCGREV